MIKQYYQNKQEELINRINIQIYLMETLQTKYSKLLEEILKCLKQDSSQEKTDQEKLLHLFEVKFIKEVEKINALKVIFDNQISKVIQKKAKEEIEKVQLFQPCERKIKFLLVFSKILYSKKFISNRQFLKIQAYINEIKAKPEFKWNESLPYIRASEDIEEFREQFFSKYAQQEQADLSDDRVKDLYQAFWEGCFKMQKISRKLLVKIDDCISKFENKSEIYDPDFLQKLNDFLGHEIGKDENEMEINKKLSRIAESEFLAANIEHKENLQAQFAYLLNILNKFSGLKIWKDQSGNEKIKLRIAKFGSNVSGFASKNTDLDITILTDCYISEFKVLEYLNNFLEAEFKQIDKKSYKLEFIHSARIPLIKLKLIKNKIQTHFDIIVNNILGVINSQFMSIYGSIKWIRQLGILIKAWGKNKRLIYEQMFSSYSFNLLLLHFLMETSRINGVLDARNRDENAPHFTYSRIVKDKEEEFKVFYVFDTRKDYVTNISRANLCGILTQFFFYYSKHGEHWKKPRQEQIITVDKSKDKAFQEDYIFTMKDPFDLTHNPGRVKHSEYNKVVSEFTQAYETLKTQELKLIDDLFR